MPKVAYQVTVPNTTGIAKAAVPRFCELSQNVQEMIDALTRDEQRLILLRLANWSLQNVEQLSHEGQVGTVAG